MPDANATSTAGVTARGYQRGAAGSAWDQYVIPVENKIVSFRGRGSTFVTPGRGGVTQRIFSLHNASGSSVLVSCNRIIVDMLQTVAKAVTVLPPIIRLNRFTGAPTGGTVLSKLSLDSGFSTNASVVATGDSSADNGGAGTASASALTITSTGVLAQVYGPRILTAVGYELVDTAQFLIGEPDVILRANEGIAVSLDQATTSTGNPTSDRWVVFCDWTEFTQP